MVLFIGRRTSLGTVWLRCACTVISNSSIGLLAHSLQAAASTESPEAAWPDARSDGDNVERTHRVTYPNPEENGRQPQQLWWTWPPDGDGSHRIWVVRNMSSS